MMRYLFGMLLALIMTMSFAGEAAPLRFPNSTSWRASVH